MRKLPCTICSAYDNFKVLYPENFTKSAIDEKIFSARRTPDKLHYQLVKCNACGLVYSNPILEEKEIQTLYTKSKLTYDKEIENLRKTYGFYLSKMKLSQKERLLEIGCGNGFFLEEAKKLGFKEVYGVEPSIEAVKKAKPEIRKNIKVDFFKKGLFKDNFFDVVCFFQTLDHVIDPNEFLINCCQILKKGGSILCITHNTDAFSAKILGEKSPIFDIEHIYLFNKNTLGEIFAKNNFEVQDTFDVVNKSSLGYLVRMLPLGQNIKNILEKVLSSSGLKNTSLNLRLGNIGLFAKKS